MKKTTFDLLALVTALSWTAVAQAQITSAASGSWTDGGTWVGGLVPTSVDDVFIASGHTISVDDLDAEGRSVSFGGDDALIDMNANSMLTVYGDFTIFSASHVAFSAGWSGTSAFIKFAGSADQILSGWNTVGGSTSFRDVIVDKDGGKLTTQGNGMRLGIQNSLEIVNGLFELAPGDDLEARWASSGNYRNAALPDITIQSGGEFYLADGAGVHHIRSSATPTSIGVVTIHGKATFRDASTNKITLAGIDVEDGGKLITSLGMGTAKFDCGPIVIKDGGELENYTTSDIWGSSASLTVDDGGLYDTKSSVTVFPASFTDNGRVRYSREGTTDQVIVDRDYNDLQISLDPDNSKIWTLAANRSVTQGVQVDNLATLVLAGSAPKSLTVGGTVTLGETASLVEPDGVTIVGTATTTRTVSQAVNEAFGGLGLQILAAGADPGVTTVTRVTGAEAEGDSPGILRYFEVSAANNAGLDATVVFRYDESELNGLSEALLTLFSWDGGVWMQQASSLDDVANTVTSSGQDSLLKLTLSEDGVVPALLRTMAAVVKGTAVDVSWRTSQPIPLVDYQVLRYEGARLDAEAIDADIVAASDFSYRFVDTTCRPGTSYRYRVDVRDGSGNATLFETKAIDVQPLAARLVQNVPNPFNPVTKIEYSIAKSEQVTLDVFDTRGRLVVRLVDSVQPAGPHTVVWTGVDTAGKAVSSGTYFYQMATRDRVLVKKMMLVR